MKAYYNRILVLLGMILLGMILLGMILFTNIFFVNTYQEPFVPKNIKMAYRPIHRNLRTHYEGLYNKHKTNASNIFRKLGIL
jgi:hypothetical protein